MESGRQSRSPSMRILPNIPTTSPSSNHPSPQQQHQQQYDRDDRETTDNESDVLDVPIFIHHQNAPPHMRWVREGQEIINPSPPPPTPHQRQQPQQQHLPAHRLNNPNTSGSSRRDDIPSSSSVINSSTPPVTGTRNERTRLRSVSRDFELPPGIPVPPPPPPGGLLRLSPVDERPELVLNEELERDSEMTNAARTLASLNQSVRHSLPNTRHFSGGTGIVAQQQQQPQQQANTASSSSFYGPGSVPPTFAPLDSNLTYRNNPERPSSTITSNHNHGQVHSTTNFERREGEPLFMRPETGFAAESYERQQQQFLHSHNFHVSQQHQYQQQRQQYPHPLQQHPLQQQQHHQFRPHYDFMSLQQSQPQMQRSPRFPAPQVMPRVMSVQNQRYDEYANAHNTSPDTSNNQHRMHSYCQHEERKRSRSEERVSIFARDHSPNASYQPQNIQRSYHRQLPIPQISGRGGHPMPIRPQNYPQHNPSFPRPIPNSLPGSPRRAPPRYYPHETEVFTNTVGRVSAPPEQFAYQHQAQQFGMHHSQNVIQTTQQQQSYLLPQTARRLRSTPPPGMMQVGSPVHVTHGLFGGMQMTTSSTSLPNFSHWSYSFTPIMTTAMSSTATMVTVSSANAPILSSALSVASQSRAVCSMMPKLPPAETMTRGNPIFASASMNPFQTPNTEKPTRKRAIKRTPSATVTKEENGEPKPTKRNRGKKAGENGTSSEANVEQANQLGNVNQVQGFVNNQAQLNLPQAQASDRQNVETSTQTTAAETTTTTNATRTLAIPDPLAVPIIFPVPFFVPFFMPNDIYSKLACRLACRDTSELKKPCQLEAILKNKLGTKPKPEPKPKKKTNKPNEQFPPTNLDPASAPSTSSTVASSTSGSAVHPQGRDDDRFVAVVVGTIPQAGAAPSQAPLQPRLPVPVHNVGGNDNVANVPVVGQHDIAEDVASMRVEREEIVVMYGVDDDDDEMNLIIHEGVSQAPGGQENSGNTDEDKN